MDCTADADLTLKDRHLRRALWSGTADTSIVEGNLDTEEHPVKGKLTRDSDSLYVIQPILCSYPKSQIEIWRT